MTEKEDLVVQVPNNYKHIYKGELKVKSAWLPYILLMLDEIDEVTRIKWLPKGVSNFVIRTLKRNQIKDIRSYFGSLRVTGNFNLKVLEIVKETRDFLDDICELCSGTGAVKSTKKGWVYNLCENCK